jgi:hypothetical protein
MAKAGVWGEGAWGEARIRSLEVPGLAGSGWPPCVQEDRPLQGFRGHRQDARATLRGLWGEGGIQVWGCKWWGGGFRFRRSEWRGTVGALAALLLVVWCDDVLRC